MNLSLRSYAAAAALLVTLAPAALAGGANAHVEGPGRDGRTYTVRTYHCANPSALNVRAWAEGLVNDKRQSVPLTLKKTGKAGVYQFTRTWPAEGLWMIRMELGDSHAPVTVTKLDEKGVVRENQLIWDSDGKKECDAMFAGKSDC